MIKLINKIAKHSVCQVTVHVYMYFYKSMSLFPSLYINKTYMVIAYNYINSLHVILYYSCRFPVLQNVVKLKCTVSMLPMERKKSFCLVHEAIKAHLLSLCFGLSSLFCCIVLFYYLAAFYIHQNNFSCFVCTGFISQTVT